MIRNKLIYLIILTALVFFYILFIDSMSLLILILALVLPFIQCFFLINISKNISASLHTENITVYKNSESKITVDIINRSVFPVSCAVATLKITNNLTEETQLLTTMMPVSASNQQSIKFSVSYEHCGNVTVVLKKIKIFDYIKLFSKTIFLNVSHEMSVIPEPVSIFPSTETTLSCSSDDDEFSKIKPGDDCSEIFNIREYAYGDKLNRIYWNLSSKFDDLMVKEYSLPVSSQIMIVFEFCFDSLSSAPFSKIDSAIEAAMSLSYFMIENEISHKICWFDIKTSTFKTLKITSEDDFSIFLGCIFSSDIYKDDFHSFIHYQNESDYLTFSHTIYISSLLSDEIFHNLSVSNRSIRKTYLYISDSVENTNDFFKTTDDINAINTNYTDISDGLSKIII